MASNLRPPYEYQKIDELNYEFVNPNKPQLIKAFGDLLSQNYYEIVV